jgi:alpha-beta hydrolase superfamily lysophospholipase
MKDMPKERTIHFEADGFRLTGTLHLPENHTPPVMIGCHGLEANRHSPKQIELARACNNAQMAYFRFDHRGCGDSQGDFARVTRLDARCADLHQAMKTLDRRDDLGPVIGLFGSSFGGAVVLKTASEKPVPALITFAAPVESRTLHKAGIDDGHLPAALEQALAFDITHCLENISNILVVHGREDTIVPVEHADIIYRHAKAPKDLILQDGGDHCMSDPVHQRQFTKRAVQWIERLSGKDN